ncbi:MAG: hypothetical protein NZ740_07680 [Kiritimatiellae bacterium]|nr:hypothetical protein [Kiritimatiellia bacterium]MDW8458975.1 hypothetical protein [Verrucomicrobiota bacterium]
MNSIVASSAAAGAALCLLLAAMAAVHVYLTLRGLPRYVEPPAPLPASTTDLQEPLPPRDAWGVFRAGSPAASVSETPDSRFRLAGTFFLYGAESEGQSEPSGRLAIIDDIARKTQFIVREGDQVEDVTVLHIEADRVRLRQDQRVFEITLSFRAASSSERHVVSTSSSEPLSMEDMPALETSRFGKRVGENRWVFRRDELLRYYAEVLEDPERIANVYASLKPVMDGESISGYVLDSEGEEDFFRAVGLREGDIIRRVNSMRMVSQRRAEYFLSEFLKNRISALVLDIEREGREEKLIYLIR